MRVYFSHAIRGVKGADATDKDMRKNCLAIVQVANQIRRAFNPKIDIYVPAEHEEFVAIAFKEKFITEGQILDVDCKIIDTCDAVICRVEGGDDVLQGGREIEVEHAKRINKPCCIFNEPKDAINWLTHMLMRGDW